LLKDEGVSDGYEIPTSRWHFDESEQKCMEFAYRGMGGNQNNFMHLDDCIKQCQGGVNVNYGEHFTINQVYAQEINLQKHQL